MTDIKREQEGASTLRKRVETDAENMTLDELMVVAQGGWNAFAFAARNQHNGDEHWPTIRAIATILNHRIPALLKKAPPPEPATCVYCKHSLNEYHDQTGCHWRQHGAVRGCGCKLPHPQPKSEPATQGLRNEIDLVRLVLSAHQTAYARFHNSEGRGVIESDTMAIGYASVELAKALAPRDSNASEGPQRKSYVPGVRLDPEDLGQEPPVTDTDRTEREQDSCAKSSESVASVSNSRPPLPRAQPDASELGRLRAEVRRLTLEEAAQHWPIGELGTLEDFRCSCGALINSGGAEQYQRRTAWQHHIRSLNAAASPSAKEK